MMNLIFPNNCSFLDEDEMSYVDGGRYISKKTCIDVAFAVASPQVLITAALGAVLIKKLINKAKYIGGVIGWAIKIAVGVSLTTVAKVAYAIGYGALKNGVNISFSPWPWDGFVGISL